MTSTVAPSTSTNAAIYCRVSQDRDGEKLAVDRQREACEKLAADRGLTVLDVFDQDNDISAFSGKARPGYERLIKGIEAGRYGVVIAFAMDRLHRSTEQQGTYIRLTREQGVSTFTVTGGEIDLSTSGGRIAANILGTLAQEESEIKRERARAKHAQSARAGKWRGSGADPFGYRAEKDAPGGLVPVPAEAELIRDGARLFLAGKTLAEIARGWAESEAGAGRTWNSTTVGQVLRSPRVAGLSVLNGEVVGAALWPAALDRDVWDRVQAIMRAPSRRTSSSTEGRHLMAGKIRCHCGGVMRTGTGPKMKDGTYRTQYRCVEKGCGTARTAGPIDDLVTEVIIERLSREDAADLLVPAVSADEAAGLKRERDALGEQIKDSLALFKARVINAAELEELRRDLGARLVQVQGRLSDPGREEILGELVRAADPEEVWGRMTWRARRRVVDVLVRVGVRKLPPGSARRFHRESIEFDWV